MILRQDIIKRFLIVFVLVVWFAGCIFVPIPIPLRGIESTSATSVTEERLTKYTIDERQIDPRLEPLVIEGMPGEQGRFLLHVVLKPKEEIKSAGVSLTCFGKQNRVLCGHSFLTTLDPDGNFVLYGETDVQYTDVEWFRVYWAATE